MFNRRPKDNRRLLHVTTVPMTLRFLRGQVGFMKKAGYEVEIASSPGEELEAFGSEECVETHAVAMERRIAPLRDLMSLAHLWREIRRANPQIVHSHTPKGGLLGMCAATLAGVPTRCYHLRGLPMMGTSGPKRELLRWCERLSCALADEVFSVSHSLRDVAIAEGLCSPNKISVLAGGSGNGVDSKEQYNPKNYGPEVRAEIRRELGIPADALVVGFVGRLVRDKGIVELAEAWQTIREAHPDAFLLLIGPAESADAVPAEVLSGFERDPRVRAVGMVDTAAAYYAAIDLIALPSYREGFPNVLLEAAAMKLPVVSTRVAGCIDAVEDGVTGSLVPHKDADALASALEHYLSSPSLRLLHGENGRRRVVECFAQERIWSALSEHYGHLTGKS